MINRFYSNSLKIFIAITISFFTCILFNSLINKNFIQNNLFVSVQTIFAFTSILFVFIILAFSVYTEFKKMCYYIAVYSLFSGLFVFFMSFISAGKFFISPEIDPYLRYICRYSFDLGLFLATCSILEINLDEKKLVKYLCFFHILALFVITLGFIFLLTGFLPSIFDKDFPVFITKHAIFWIKFIPYIFGIYLCLKRLVIIRSNIYIILLTCYFIGLAGQTWDEFVYFHFVKGSYSVGYYFILFLGVFSFKLSQISYNLFLENKELIDRIRDESSDLEHEIEKTFQIIRDANNLESAKNYSNELQKKFQSLFYIVKSNPGLHLQTQNINHIINDSIEYVSACYRTIIQPMINAYTEDNITLYTDYGKLRIIFDNLFINAYEQCKDNISLEINIKKGTNHLSNYFLVEVINEGHIDKEKLNDIFYRGYSTKSSKYSIKKRGLGLSIAKKNIIDLGGYIKCQSYNGKVIFTVCIPIISEYKINSRNVQLSRSNKIKES